jgi:hypothetical protein
MLLSLPQDGKWSARGVREMHVCTSNGEFLGEVLSFRRGACFSIRCENQAPFLGERSLEKALALGLEVLKMLR